MITFCSTESRGEFTAELCRHDSLKRFHDRGGPKTVIFKLFCAVINRKAGASAQKLVVSRFVCGGIDPIG